MTDEKLLNESAGTPGGRTEREPPIQQWMQIAPKNVSIYWIRSGPAGSDHTKPTGAKSAPRILPDGQPSQRSRAVA